MTQYKKVLESKMKIRFHDCDPYNHLNNSRYIDYIITARGDQLIDYYGFNMYELLRQEGIGWVTAHTEISYFAPAMLMEEVTIQTQLIHCSEKSLHLEGIMWNGDKTQIKAILWARLVHFNIRAQKSQQHSKEFMQFFLQVVNPLPASQLFADRIKSLKQYV